LDDSPVRLANAVTKEAVTYKAVDASKIDLVDAGGGRGVVLNYAAKLGVVSSINTYTNVDPDAEKTNSLLRDSSGYLKRSNFPLSRIRIHNADINDHLVSMPSRGYAIVAINSIYNFTYRNIKNVVSSGNKLSGVAMFADLLFDTDHAVSDVEFDVKYDKTKNLVSGNIAGLGLLERPVVTAMFPAVYPVKFMHPYRFAKSMPSTHAYWRSFAYFFNNPLYELVDIPGRVGRPFLLVNGNYVNKHLSRPVVHKLVAPDYKWYARTGCYISAKLNGVGAFMYNSQGVWQVPLRGGQTLLPYSYKFENGVKIPVAPYKFESSLVVPGDDKIFIEIVSINGHDYPFYLGSIKPSYTKVDPSDYWDEKWSSFTSKLTDAKSRYPGLSFKPYFAFGKDFKREPGSIVLGKIIVDGKNFSLPNDGCIFTDPLGNHSSYWKPIETVDIDVTFLKGRPVARDYPRIDLVDPRKICTLPGLFECVYKRSLAGNDKAYVGTYRPDKLKPTNLYDLSESVISGLDVEDVRGIKIILLGGVRVILQSLTFEGFCDGTLTRPFDAVMKSIINTVLPRSVILGYAKRIIQSLRDCQVMCKIGNVSAVPVSVYIKTVANFAPDADPFYVWNHLKIIGFANNYPDKGEVRNFIGVYEPAFEFISDFTEPAIVEDDFQIIEMDVDNVFRLYKVGNTQYMRTSVQFQEDRSYHLKRRSALILIKVGKRTIFTEDQESVYNYIVSY
jgi:hypothetical protein